MPVPWLLPGQFVLSIHWPVSVLDPWVFSQCGPLCQIFPPLTRTPILALGPTVLQPELNLLGYIFKDPILT